MKTNPTLPSAIEEEFNVLTDRAFAGMAPSFIASVKGWYKDFLADKLAAAKKEGANEAVDYIRARATEDDSLNGHYWLVPNSVLIAISNPST